jgi:ribosome recycling factor
VTHETLVSIEPKMKRAVEAMERDFAAIRTGRASTALVERLMVDYYGTPTPINQVAGISVPDAHLIVIQPWDRSVLSAIERAITKSEIGLVPNVDGTVVRLNVPPLTEERRHELVKQVRRRTEDARVEVRNHRREAADQLKKALRDGSLSEDEERRELENLQRLTDRYVEAIDARADRKEAEVLEV